MENTWIIFEGGVSDIFKGNKHSGDPVLVPFTTKNSPQNCYVNFSGVVGAFSKILSDTA